MPRFHINADTEEKYITIVDAPTEEEARAEAIRLIRANKVRPLVTGFTRIVVTRKDSQSLPET